MKIGDKKKPAILTTDTMFNAYFKHHSMIGESDWYKTRRGAEQAARAFWRREENQGEEESVRLIVIGPEVSGFSKGEKWGLYMTEKRAA